ncbi:metallophosphoesterase family protein [Oribacterium sp. WCC10]|uniref:metallophosphoesterase family protein n=1 Tax=Oribacterium sp. WCC10 TaxID=1855343 RepID=UPI001587D8B4|nr:metallophosphoesterase [Oribacterium sp. WCC10]
MRIRSEEAINESSFPGSILPVNRLDKNLSVIVRFFVLAVMSAMLLTACGSNGVSGQNVSGNVSDSVGDASLHMGSDEPLLKQDSLWSDGNSLKAMIISDLHYTEYKEVDHKSVPGMAVAEEIADTIVQEVISKHPDVFIMTGDNTNSGYSGDVSGLIAKLRKIKDSGIPVIVTTGNHDFDLMNEAEYEEAYSELPDPVDRDPSSLSYTAIVKDVVFLAMDDKALHIGAQGEFSDETMKWLRAMLEKYKGRKVVFLSHHNVLYGTGEKGEESHVIHNKELPQVLRDGGVKLVITGHMHSQYITEADGLWEILSGMPYSGKHLMGNLAVGDDRMVYYAEPIDFDTYGSSVEPELQKLEAESSDFLKETLSGLLEGEGLQGVKKENVLKLIERFFLYYEEGSIAEHKEDLKKDPNYKDMLKALWNHNYGPWMESMIENTKHSGRELEIVM